MMTGGCSVDKHTDWTNDARNFLRLKAESRRAILDQRFQVATREFDLIVSMVVNNYSPRAIYQWGSLLDRERFSELSDIDIAIDGDWEPSRFFALLRDAEALATLPLDIVDLSKIEPEFRDLILLKGRLVYGSKR